MTDRTTPEYRRMVDPEHGDARTPEWHQERALEAINSDLRDLAHAHLYLAAELDRAIGIRAKRWRRSQGLPEEPTPLEMRRLWRMINGDDRTREVPLVGRTRDETPARRHLHATAEPVHLDAPEHSGPPGPTLPRRDPGQTTDRRTCQTCGVVIAWVGVDGPPGTRVVHLNELGMPHELDHDPVP